MASPAVSAWGSAALAATSSPPSRGTRLKEERLPPSEVGCLVEGVVYEGLGPAVVGGRSFAEVAHGKQVRRLRSTAASGLGQSRAGEKHRDRQQSSQQK